MGSATTAAAAARVHRHPQARAGSLTTKAAALSKTSIPNGVPLPSSERSKPQAASSV